MTDTVTHPHLNRRVRSTLMASALLVGIAACGSDDNSSNVTTPSGASVPAVTTPAAGTTAGSTAGTPLVTADSTPPTSPSSAPSASTGGGSATTAAGSASGAGTTVKVTETEFKIDLNGTTTFAPGDYEFDITNSGKFKHNLIVVGPGIADQAKSPTFEAGQAGKLNVTLQAGSYELYCGVPTHKGKGMDMTITVA